MSSNERPALSSSPNSTLSRAPVRWFVLPARAEMAICGRLLLALAAVLLDYWLAPSLYNGSAIWALAALLLLIFRRGQATPASEPEFALGRLSAFRVALFVALHVGIVLAGREASAPFSSAAGSDAAASALLSAAKLLILLPCAVLFSRSDWMAILRNYRAELLAAGVVLLTFFPYRLFHTLWPEYSQLIASLAYVGAKPFVAGLELIHQPIPTILGPKIGLEIVFWCSGYSALALFDALVAMIALLDWNELHPKRLLIAYVCGGAAILAANIVRIIVLVLVGNLIAPQYAMGRFHVNAGWAFFALIYLLILTVSYSWMVAPASPPASDDQVSRKEQKSPAD